jgi:hypothetical protein
VEVVAEQPGVQRFPPASFVAHTDQICDQDVVVNLRVTSAGRRMTGNGPGEAFCRRTQLGTPAPATLVLYNTVEVAHCGVTFGVEDLVHVLGPADHTQLRYRFVRAYDELHAGSHAVHETLAALGVAGAASAKDRPPLVDVHLAVEAEAGRASAAPSHWRLTSGRVVLESTADGVVAPAQDRAFVVADRVGAHHPHPRHRSAPSPLHRRVNWDLGNETLYACSK